MEGNYKKWINRINAKQDVLTDDNVGEFMLSELSTKSAPTSGDTVLAMDSVTGKAVKIPTDQFGGGGSGGDTSNLVPYTGANKDVNIGAYYFETSQGFKKTGGTSNQFLMADGSTNSNTYAKTDGTNATDNWSNTSSGLSLNPAVTGKTLNASGQDVYLRDATYGQISGIVQDDTNSPLANQWTNRLKTLHNNSAGYFTELAQSFTEVEGVWHRRNYAGTISSWKQLYDDSIWNAASLSYSGSTLTLTINGISKTATINAGTNYTLPTASATVLGGVKIGSGISIDGNGVISANTFTSGTANRLAKFSGNNLADSIIYDNGASVGIGTTTLGARLDVKAQGALSTDIAFRVRNSTNTQNFLVVTGAGEVYNRGAKGHEFNTFFGEYSGINSTGGGNNAFGRSALASNTTGHANSAFGNNVLQDNTTGDTNNAFGAQSLISNITGTGNNAFGYNALESNTEGNDNIAIGSAALGYNTTGNDNTAIGSDAGGNIIGGLPNTTPNNSVFIGFGTTANADNETNQIVIGHSARGDGSNSVVLGNSSITRTRLQGQVIIGSFTSPPSGIEGAIYYNSTTKKHYGFDGTSWNAYDHSQATITVELISQLTTNFYAPNALRINSTSLISGSGTLTLKVNDVAYTLGNLIPQGAKITAETTSSSVYNLISIYE